MSKLLIKKEYRYDVFHLHKLESSHIFEMHISCKKH